MTAGTPLRRAPGPNTAAASSALPASQRTAVTDAPHLPRTTSPRNPAETLINLGVHAAAGEHGELTWHYLKMIPTHHAKLYKSTAENVFVF